MAPAPNLWPGARGTVSAIIPLDCLSVIAV
jgi:hypothetical protein